MKRWNVNEYDNDKITEIAKRCDLSKLALKVMNTRGYKDLDSVSAFFETGELSDPFLIKDMREAVDAINNAVDSYDPICIYGDYDCDGVTATSILFSYLDNIGANVSYYIPERSEGYGLNNNAIDSLAEQGIKLIVTVDNGISAVNEAEYIYEHGMKLVVTDHHQPSEILPKAEAVVDLHRKDCPSVYKELSGAGVALMLCVALNEGNDKMIIEQFSDVCAVGTIADVVPLTGENRLIVKQGLKYLRHTENYGLDMLLDKSGVRRDSVTASTVAFQISPRINASGRFGSPLTAVKALLSDDSDDAEMYVDTMIELNDERRTIEGEILKAILHAIDKNPALLNKRVLILVGKNWHCGVIGIVASKLLDIFGKPTILIEMEKDGTARGSARSIKGFDIFKCLSYASDVLVHFGGHECAGGFTVNNDDIPKFMNSVYEYADGFETMPSYVVECDLKLSGEDITVDNVKGLQKLEPFGAGNLRPVFYMPRCRINRITPMSQSKHIRLDVTYENTNVQIPVFNKTEETFGYKAGDTVELAVNLDINTYNRNDYVDIRVVDIRPFGLNQDKYFNAKDCYEKYMSGKDLPEAFLKRIMPDRTELVNAYKIISQAKTILFDQLYSLLRGADMNYCKLRLIIDAFREKELVSFTASNQIVKILPVKEKVDLESATVLVELRNKL